ncbi:MAG: 3-methyl-2-oxobutanoate hydroxymethyltransferase, partial [Gemmatimonadetes bacterium]|nr:3-methyl-2-oxobutanoate hydroxymethyltransferase [Gemmatimonadota bacterium]
PSCDGQVLVFHDLLGIENQLKPKFVKRYAELSDAMIEAISQYRREVKDGTFPDLEHSYGPGEEGSRRAGGDDD